MPILTRIYAPHDFGILSIFSAFLAMSAPMATLRYATAMPLPRTSAIAANLLVASLCLLALTTTTLAGLVLLLGDMLFNLTVTKDVAQYSELIVIGFLCFGLAEIFRMWATRAKSFREISLAAQCGAFSGAVAKMALGMTALKPSGLIIGQALISAFEAGFLFLRSGKRFVEHMHKLSRRNMILCLWHYRGYPIYRVPADFLLAFSSQAPLVFIASLYQTDIAGQVGLAFMAIALPVTLISTNLGKAYYGEIAKMPKGRRVTLRKLTESFARKLFVFSVPICLILAAAGPSLFPLVFGDEWGLAGEIVRILALYLPLQIMASPLSNAYNYLNLQNIFLYQNLVRAIAVGCVFALVALMNLKILHAVLLYSIVMLFFYAFTIANVFYFLGRETNQ